MSGCISLKNRALQLLVVMLLLAVPHQGTTQNNSLLWEVSGNGLDKPSYLFGTIHLICQGDFLPGDSLKAALNTTGHLLLELDVTDPELTTSLMQHLFMKDGKTLSDLISPEEYSRVSGFFKDSIGFDLSMMAGAKPFLLSSLIFTKILNCPAESFEGRLAEISQKNGASVGGLETAEEQTALFDTIPYDRQAELIVNLIDSLHDAREHFQQTLAIYKKQDIEAIYNFTLGGSFGFTGFEDAMLHKRNKRWIPMIERSARENPTFVAVGAAHLGGPDGIVNLLKERGFTLRAVPN